MTTETAPRFNHIAISVPPELVDAEGRAALIGFYGDVFGWTEMPTMSRDRELCVLRAWTNEQFVYLVASESPMRCPPTDHFGLSVASVETLHGMLERARKRAESDPEVDLTEVHVQDFGVLKLHNFYVRYRLPMSVEVQCFEWADGFGADSLPDDDGA